MNPDRDIEAAAGILARAGRRLSEDRWARSGMARTARGRPCASTDERAVRWSLLGAVHIELDRCGYGRHKEDRVYRLALDALEEIRPGWRAWHETPGRRARHVEQFAKHAAKQLKKEQP